MEYLLANGFHEITLVLFTTLAPLGAVAFLVAAAPLVREPLSLERRMVVLKWLSIPLVAASVGLVVSATHLGNPANALYVVAGIGRSPLSNEVAAAILFLVSAGTFWLASFGQRQSLPLMRAWYAELVVAAVLFVAAVGLAYGVDTIPAWNLPTVPLSIWANAVLGGTCLGAATVRLARAGFDDARARAVELGAMAVALAANGAVYLAHRMLMQGMRNAIVHVEAVMPLFDASLLAFLLLSAGAVGARVLQRRDAQACDRRSGPTGEGVAVRLMVVAELAPPAAIAVGVFLMRFSFYCTHFTVGLAV
ncbi:dimethyl sulfoxide reductase anchor subunit [Eggerthellaceae bacterium zg-1084]|uniref:dimethyl sulfoxide reductase anchor subunit family protein n=1 Tax=Berryella wangjianweii TaxID=2734634 RepID=UPI0015558F9A|nr:DmsC/YnfH family molybdoenzyme membrane anchor subunit [Berryella wangjianweii]NPD30655.1 dimethyl sulfoxide reductase anchor subunit [Berryella wangjianweii]